MLELSDNEIILGAIALAFCCWCVILLWKNSNLKNTIESDRALYKSQEHLEERFKNISNEVLVRNHHNFLNIARETFDKVLNIEKAEYDRKQNSFASLIKPIQETLSLFDDKISQIERDRVDAYSDLRRQVKDLMLYQREVQKEASALNKALSTPFVAGQWGEMQLRRVVELSGMLQHCDFVEQQQSENSRLRPDMIIKLPGNRHIIVDAKAPVDAYMNAMNTGEDEYLENHAKRIKSHVKTLSQKAYWEQFSHTPEFVLMFLPGESFFSAAIKKDPTLLEFGIQENVIITTPITLIALLKAISFSWQQEAIAKNTKQIGEVGRAVFYSLEKLIEYSRSFEKKLQRNLEDYEKIGNFIEKKLSPAAKKLKVLGGEIEDKPYNTSEGIDNLIENVEQLEDA